MRKIAIVCAIAAMSLPALADEPYAPGVWVCESGGICVDPRTVRRSGTKANGEAMIHFRGQNHRATLIRDCLSAYATTVGVEGLAEDVRIEAGHPWMCESE